MTDTPIPQPHCTHPIVRDGKCLSCGAVVDAANPDAPLVSACFEGLRAFALANDADPEQVYRQVNLSGDVCGFVGVTRNGREFALGYQRNREPR